MIDAILIGAGIAAGLLALWGGVACVLAWVERRDQRRELLDRLELMREE